MRNRPSSSMQKTYDDCYLTCSTAVYFENQSNEIEALRSWRSALDQIYYHNAYKVPANYHPKSATEKALQDSLREMEIQCKERVDLLEALRQSRIQPESGGDSASAGLATGGVGATSREPSREERGWLGQGTVPVVKYPDYSRPAPPPLPQRPVVLSKKSSGPEVPRSSNPPQGSGTASRLTTSPPSLPVPQKHVSRSPSPEKKGLLMTLRNGKEGRRMSRSPKVPGNRKEPAAAAKAATQAWGSLPRSEGEKLGQSLKDTGSAASLITPSGENMAGDPMDRGNANNRHSAEYPRGTRNDTLEPPSPSDFLPRRNAPPSGSRSSGHPHAYLGGTSGNGSSGIAENLHSLDQNKSSPRRPADKHLPISSSRTKSPERPSVTGYNWKSSQSQSSSNSWKGISGTSSNGQRQDMVGNQAAIPNRRRSPNRRPHLTATRTDPLSPKPMANTSTPRSKGPDHRKERKSESLSSEDDSQMSGRDLEGKSQRTARKLQNRPIFAETPTTDISDASESPILSPAEAAWKKRTEYLMKNLPKGVDEAAAKQIFNEIVIQGDEVRWDDVAGLDVAKNALKEAVVYPFLRPDLFMGLREPARGMLLFGPPGTGKTMLARAVATESKSTFFSISASSLTSKYLGESEKLVRALFSLARALAPSIIFVDEIDSLLSSRSGSGEHEATRRIKTEFLIQWSDLARAAAGRDSARDKDKEDPSRVLVLAATNLPWAIDEAARRRFVRRQYIPLPEGPVRATQLRSLLSHQKHSLVESDIARLVELTDTFSGSDITALAKDAAMGPLRSLGEALLQMSTDEIRPIGIQDFEKSLISIRPSVSPKGLGEFEEWAREFGERGG
ncbi:MAG: hypothetical protein M1837_001218 [Sclerophora amabilis]|nr:MAG: hypothetical protein M1837_001218 [Sclerophora amabilis]